MEVKQTRNLYASTRVGNPELELMMYNDCNYYYDNEFEQLKSEEEITGKSYDNFISIVKDTMNEKKLKSEY